MRTWRTTGRVVNSGFNRKIPECLQSKLATAMPPRSPSSLSFLPPQPAFICFEFPFRSLSWQHLHLFLLGNMAILFYGKVKIILFSSLFPHSRDGFTWKKIMTGFTNWPDSCDAESELAEQGQWGISVPIMAKIDNAFCKLLLPKEMNKCRRQGKPSFCMKAPAHLDQCNYQEGVFFSFSFLSFFGVGGGGEEESEKEWDARKKRLFFKEC